MFQLYDRQLIAAKKQLGSLGEVKSSADAWPLSESEELILKKDMAFEFGGNKVAAVSGIMFTTLENLIPETAAFLKEDYSLQKDLETEESINYARFVFVRLNEEIINDYDSQKLYALFRKLEYIRYHIFPEGFAIRASTSQHKEIVRISKKAVEKGFALDKIAQDFIQSYLKVPEVAAVEIHFVALVEKNPVFDEFKKLSLEAQEITESLNVIFKGLKMDCSTCDQKIICDQIEGMKELHGKV